MRAAAILIVVLMLPCAAALGASPMWTCSLLMQFEEDPGILADSTGLQPDALASGAVSAVKGRFGGGCHLGDAVGERRPMALFCWQAPESPDFVDFDAERTWVRRNGQWVTMGEVVNHEFINHRMCGIAVGAHASQAERIAIKGSRDGRFCTAIATDVADSLGFNFATATNCMHSNPGWDMLKPGEEQTATGKIYFVEGTVDDVYALYLSDFAPQP